MNENAIIGGVSEIVRRGMVVPEDFSILSIVFSPLAAEMVQPSPTTLHSPGAELGRLGVHFLLDKFDGRGPVGGTVMLPCRSEAGQSSGRPAGASPATLTPPLHDNPIAIHEQAIPAGRGDGAQPDEPIPPDPARPASDSMPNTQEEP